MYAELEDVPQKYSVTEGHSNEIPHEEYALNSLARGRTTICQTGFNAGHSALRFLLHSNAHVYLFDLGSHDYAKPAADWIQDRFPDRHSVIWGDSAQTLPSFHEQNPNLKCDLIFIDGGHSKEIAQADFGNFRAMATSTSKVFIDDVHCSAGWCLGPHTVLQDAIKSASYTEEGSGMVLAGDRGWSWGSYSWPATSP